MTVFLKGSLKTCRIPEFGVVHIYHPVTRMTLCERSLTLHQAIDIHPNDVETDLCPICVRRHNNESEV